ncbi:MAG: acyl-CoA thioesterase [Flavobacteriia bacterium]|nr:acyl-CoA thioesterase [Flavobacteriia bacterium]
MNLTPFPVFIRFSDCDLMGHVNNASYLNYFEDARIHYFSQLLPNWDWKTQGIILRKNTIEYLSPLYLHDKANITILLKKIGNKSFTLAYELLIQNELKAMGESVLVCYNFNIQKSTTVYPEWIPILNQLEKK